MKTTMTRVFGTIFVMFLAITSARPSSALLGEEAAVIQALATVLNRDSKGTFDFLYYESDFPARAIIDSAISNPDRTQFCGLTREQAQAMVGQLAQLTSEPVEFGKDVAKPAGLSIGHKKLERFRYLTLSRVVFAPGGQQAWLAADLNGETGAVYKLEKVGGGWSKTARCAGWVKTAP
jgi:hypothetical protein